MASFSYGILDAHRGALLFALAFFYLQTADAAPSITVNKSSTGQKLTVSITGSGFPAAKRISLTCSYDAHQCAIMDAIVGSPLPSTALSVLVDTAARVLTMNMAAASTIAVADGSLLVKLQIPCVPQGTATAFAVTKAAITDNNGAVSEAAIDPTAAVGRRAAHPLVPAIAPAGTALRYFYLDGRRYATLGTRSASGCLLASMGGSATSVTNLLQPGRQR